MTKTEEIMELATSFAEAATMTGAGLALFSGDSELFKSRVDLLAERKDTLKSAIEELVDDAARYRWMIKNATWYRESDDAIMAFRVAKKSNLSCIAMRQLAIDAAMEKTP